MYDTLGWRMRELAESIHYAVVNGEVLLEKRFGSSQYFPPSFLWSQLMTF